MTLIPLEDSYADIVGKALRGLKISHAELAVKSRVSEQELTVFLEGEFKEEVARRVAPVLGLGVEQLVATGQKAWYPQRQEVSGLALFNTPFGDMTVNAYLVWDPQTKQAVAVDTGADVGSMLEFAGEKGLKIELILITHTHEDHIADLSRLKAETGASVHVHELEGVVKTGAFREDQVFTVGGLTITTLLTSGHAIGGTTFVVQGLERPVAIVGDAIFAGSMGGGKVSYADALRNNREKILTLAPETILCPGHGPLTSVAEERLHNPFFP
jgi:hydroxyacylglutathione hydrolase